MSLRNIECGLLLTFCQFFFNKETRKLTLSWTFWKICFSSILTLPTATPMQSTFLSWNLTMALDSLTFDSRVSWWVTSVGNFPARLHNISISTKVIRKKHNINILSNKAIQYMQGKGLNIAWTIGYGSNFR